MRSRWRAARGLRLRLDWSKVPLLEDVEALAAAGFVTGASGRNWAGYGAEVALGASLPPTARDLLADPQTSGGLLVACDPFERGRRARHLPRAKVSLRPP